MSDGRVFRNALRCSYLALSHFLTAVRRPIGSFVAAIYDDADVISPNGPTLTLFATLFFSEARVLREGAESSGLAESPSSSILIPILKEAKAEYAKLQ